MYAFVGPPSTFFELAQTGDTRAAGVLARFDREANLLANPTDETRLRNDRVTSIDDRPAGSCDGPFKGIGKLVWTQHCADSARPETALFERDVSPRQPAENGEKDERAKISPGDVLELASA
ncbi:MAG: hypothetical protein ACRDRU_29205 [Pseudonocardiaceae bacterium]